MLSPGSTCTRSAIPSFCGSRASTFSTSSTSTCTGTGPKAVGSPLARLSIELQIRPALVLAW